MYVVPSGVTMSSMMSVKPQRAMGAASCAIALRASAWCAADIRRRLIVAAAVVHLQEAQPQLDGVVDDTLMQRLPQGINYTRVTACTAAARY
jgi:hypothetical protein